MTVVGRAPAPSSDDRSTDRAADRAETPDGASTVEEVVDRADRPAADPVDRVADDAVGGTAPPTVAPIEEESAEEGSADETLAEEESVEEEEPVDDSSADRIGRDGATVTVGGDVGRARRSLPYLPALDGLRAVAVLAVLVYHLGLADGRAAGGYLGVEVFFVISGYLITALLLDEHRRSGTVALASFWMRRARRLLPAVAMLIGVVVVGTAVFARSDLARLRGDALASLLYVQNWHAVIADQSYFATFGRPSPLQHLWSLSIEEQFYLLWPIVILGAASRLRRGWLVALTFGSAVASMFLMAALTDVTSLERGYYGTDTRAFGLLIGAGLAMVWRPGRRFVDRRGKQAPWAIDVLAVAALLALLWQLDRRSEYDRWTFPMGLIWVDLLTAALIVACATVGSKVGALLSARPLVAIGRRSYSLYLWHWPVFVFTRPGTDIGLEGWSANILRLGLAAALAAVTYRFVEQPIREGRLQERLRALRRGRRPVVVRSALLAGTAMLLALVVATVTAEAEDDAETVPTVAVEVPAATVAPSSTVPEPGRSPDTAPGDRPSSSTPVVDSNPAVPPPPVTQAVTAIGDSVMLGAQRGLENRFTDATIDAAVGRQADDIVDEVASLADQGVLAPTVVVHAGNNGPIPGEDLEDLLEAVGDRHLFLVNVSVPRRWEAQVNETIASFVEDHPEVTLVDWSDAAAGADGLRVDDGVHLTGEGIARYADLIASAVRGS